MERMQGGSAFCPAVQNPSGEVNVNEVQDEATESDLLSEEGVMKKATALCKGR